MSACTFFGHRECYGLNKELLRNAIESFILQGVDTYYVGNQGQFDATVYKCLKTLQTLYPHIHISVVLAYLPIDKTDYLDDAMYPEIEGHPKFAIERRNKWMIGQAHYCLCYINHTWGGAYKFFKMAKRHGLTVINLGTAHIASQAPDD